MAISFSSTKVARFAGALYGVALNSNTYSAAMQEIALRGFDAVANDVYNADFGSQSTTAVANILVSNLGLTGQAATDGAAYITAQLNGAAAAGRGAVVSNILSAFAGLNADAEFGTFATAFEGRVSNALLYSQSANNAYHSPFGTLASGLQYNLSTGFDNITGTSGDDTFYAYSQNNTNTLQDGDIVNGGSGTDTLIADVTSQTLNTGAIAPRTNSVEKAVFRVQHDQVDSGDNNIATKGIIDAERLVGIKTIEDNNSRADLVVEDVRIQPSEITKDITIVMRDTDPGNVDYGVYFDQNSLRNVSTGTTSVSIKLMDTGAAGNSLTAATPLLNNPYDQFKIGVNGVLTTIQLDKTAVAAADTYAQLLTVFQTALAGSGMTVALSDPFTIVDPISNTSVTGQSIVLTGSAGIAISTVTGSGWFNTTGASVPPTSNIYTTYATSATSQTELVTSTITLDNVGRGSNGGSLIVGGLSVGATSASKGVQQFDITVEDSSKLYQVQSTNNTLRVVNIKNGTTDVKTDAYVTHVQDAGDIYVLGSSTAKNAGGSDLPAAENDAYGFTDVQTINASTMRGKVNFNANVTTASIGKYLNLTDTGSVHTADNVAFNYTGGTNNDSISVTLDQAVVGSTNTLSGREDFTFNVDGGSGDDSLSVTIGGDQTAAWYADQKQNANITVNGGAGNDTIRTVGAGDFIVNAGDGNDTVYIDNSGTIGAKWVVGATNATLADLQTAGLNSGFLWKGKLTVSLVGPNAAASVTSTAGADSVSNTYDNGFEVVVDIPTGANSTVTQLYINQAIKNAINNDAVLSKLALAQDGPASTLVISSLIDGAFNASDLRITVSSTDLTTLSVADQSAALTAYKSYAHNSQATIAMAQTANAAAVTATNGMNGMDATPNLAANGTNSAARSDSTIDLATGTDVLVMGTGANSHDTLVFNGYDLGNKTVVNFSTTASALGNNGDNLNFASYLTGQFRAAGSGSLESQNLIPISLNGDNVTEANSVTVVSGLSFNTTTATFAGLNASNLKAAINSTNIGLSNYGGITAGTLDAAHAYTDGVGATLVGGTGKAVVMVENNLNRGEYKVFELTFNGLSTNATGDYTDVKQIANVDFGHELTLSTNMIQNTAASMSGLGGGGGAGGGAGGGGGAVAQTIAVAAAGTAPAETAATNTTFNVTNGTYTYNIAGFGTGDKLVFPTAGLATIVNAVTNDGIVDVQYADAGQTVTIHLTGIAAATDATIFGAGSFNTAFGAGSLN